MAASSKPTRAFERADIGLLLVEGRFGGKIALGERLQAGKLALALFELGHVLGAIGLGLSKLAWSCLRVEHEQRIARLDILALGHRHLIDHAVDARADGDAGYGLRPAHCLEFARPSSW